MHEQLLQRIQELTKSLEDTLKMYHTLDGALQEAKNALALLNASNEHVTLNPQGENSPQTPID